MFMNAEIMLDLAHQHQADLMAEARTVSLAHCVRRARQHRRQARAAARRDSAEIGHPNSSPAAGSLGPCEVLVAELVR